MVKSFVEWCGDKKLELPVLTEKQARSGTAHWAYPDLYVRSHYPDGWFMPRAADTLQKFGKHDPTHTLHKSLHQIHPSHKIAGDPKEPKKHMVHHKGH
jgi:hypothetical protein